MHRAPTLLFCVLLGHNHNYVFYKEFEESFFFEEKVISYWFFAYRKGTTGLPRSLRELAMTMFRNDDISLMF